MVLAMPGSVSVMSSHHSLRACYLSLSIYIYVCVCLVQLVSLQDSLLSDGQNNMEKACTGCRQQRADKPAQSAESPTVAMPPLFEYVYIRAQMCATVMAVWHYPCSSLD